MRIKKEKKGKRDEKVCTVERVDIGKGSSYCKPCYRARRDDPSIRETATERRLNYQSYRLGCKRCGEYVCDKCWKLYDHKAWQCSKL